MQAIEPVSSVLPDNAVVLSQCRPTLLVADDEPGPRESLRIIFEDDYNVLSADNAAAAMELLRENIVHAAVLDIRMGAVSGIELLQQIKEYDADVAVIMLTAFEELETARQALRLGACDYLSKPFDLATMRSAVSKAIERNFYARQVRASQERLRDIQGQLSDFQVKEELARKRGDIYGMVFHDINNPLTVISGLATLAGEQLSEVAAPEGGDLASIREQLAQIEQQVHYCHEMSRRYLGYARRQPAGQASVCVNQVLSDVGMFLRRHPSRTGHELTIWPMAEDAVVRVNGTDIIQILLNLTINALQCVPQPHKVSVSARFQPDPLDQVSCHEGPHACFIKPPGFANEPPFVQFCVKDNGPGISAVPLRKIFDAFYTTKPVGQGTGLGLTIVMHLIEQAQAGLHVTSQPGEGTSFNVFVRAQPPIP